MDTFFAAQASLVTLNNDHEPFSDQCFYNVETSQLSCTENQLTGFYMIGTLALKRLQYSKETLSQDFQKKLKR